jgi:hypothetical protein
MTRPQPRSLLLSLAGLVLLATGCPQEASPPSSASPAAAPAAAGGAAGDRVKIKKGDGSTAFEIKGKDDGAKVVDANEAELYRLKAKKGKVKVRDPQDKTLGYVKHYPDGDYFKVKDASQETDLFKLQPQADGDWKLEDGNQKLLCKLKKRDYGWVVRDAEEKDLFKVKVADGKTSLRNAKDETVYYTKGKVSSLAFCALGLSQLDESQRLGLLFQVDAAGK